MARILIQATLPHSRARSTRIPHEFERVNGRFTLYLNALPSVGLPGGSYPRLTFAWLSTEAVRTRSRELELAPTFSSFMYKLGLTPITGKRGTTSRLRDQLHRLFSATIRCSWGSGDWVGGRTGGTPCHRFPALASATPSLTSTSFGGRPEIRSGNSGTGSRGGQGGRACPRIPGRSSRPIGIAGRPQRDRKSEKLFTAKYLTSNNFRRYAPSMPRARPIASVDRFGIDIPVPSGSLLESGGETLFQASRGEFFCLLTLQCKVYGSRNLRSHPPLEGPPSLNRSARPSPAHPYRRGTNAVRGKVPVAPDRGIAAPGFCLFSASSPPIPRS